MHQNNQNNKLHQPVLLDSVLQYLSPKEGESYLDLTAGYGGHAAAILARTLAPTRATLVDRDHQAIASLKAKFAGQQTHIIHQDYMQASQRLVQTGEQFDIILADLGISSPHLDKASRGFSFRQEGPLDMRMDQRLELTAANIVNNYSKAELAKLLKTYGEEPKANTIAQMIVDSRPISNTTELASIVARAWPGPARKIHPATRTFQAIRIAVNDELGQLETALPLWLQLLAPGGRIAIISFHSLEDRMVKQFLQDHNGDRYDAVLSLLTKRPVGPDATEIVSNPRARSAKLRAAVKQK